MNVLVGDELAPEPMLLPDQNYLFDGYALGLGQKEGDEGSHDRHPPGEEVEEAKLEVTQCGQKHLGDQEREEHVDGDGDALPSRADLEGEDLTWYQPPQRPP